MPCSAAMKNEAGSQELSARLRRPGSRLVRSFYSRALTEAERDGLSAALGIEDIDQEIAVLRVRLRQALQERPQDLKLMFDGIELLTKAVATRYRLSKKAEKDLSDSLANVIRGLGDIWQESAGA